MKVAGVVLAGGLSRRMGGQEKSLLELAGAPLLHRVADRLDQQVDTLAINANGDADRFGELRHPIIPDPIEGFVGPLAGVLAGIKWATQNTDITHVVSVAADTPFFPDNLVDAFTTTLSGKLPNTIAIASTDGRLHPVFGLWPVAVAASLEDFLIKAETRKVLAFVDQHGLVETPFDGVVAELGFDPFFNINTPEDLTTAHAHLRAEQS